MENTKITICSVCHSDENQKLLELNHNSVSRLNPEKNWIWMVADNTPDGKLSERMDTQKFQVVPGLTMQKLLSTLNPIFLEHKAGFHHSTAVHGMLPLIKTRFFLLLDSDLYMLRPNWINDVLEYMEKSSLAVFDVPWHPKWFKKPRYLPATHAIFVDSTKLKLTELNFFPQLSLEPAAWIKKLSLPRKIKNLVLGRVRVGLSRDMGFIIGEKLQNENLKYECAVPVFNPAFNILNFLLPDRFSYIPKKSGSYSKKDFNDFGYPSFPLLSLAEKFMWKEKPFSFHLRGHKSALGRGGETFDDLLKELKSILDAFFERDLDTGTKL